MKRVTVCRSPVRCIGVGVVALVWSVAAAAAQSPPLGEVARQEAERRREQPAAAKISSKTRTRCARCCGTRSSAGARRRRGARSARGRAGAAADEPGLVLSDLRLPTGDGFGVLRAAKELDPDCR
jgi:CheY-like chemotaxis protein